MIKQLSVLFNSSLVKSGRFEDGNKGFCTTKCHFCARLEPKNSELVFQICERYNRSGEWTVL